MASLKAWRSFRWKVSPKQSPSSPTRSSAIRHRVIQRFSFYDVDIGDVRGQESANRAMTLAATGRYNLIMIGPPGSGKTMLAKRMPTILPQLSAPESIETTRIYSALGQLPAGQPLLARRPFRSPHHTISDAGLVGGGSPPSPGEISKAHNGILFLDELPEFNRKTLKVMRQPMEDGVVTISRALRSTTFPDVGATLRSGWGGRHRVGRGRVNGKFLED